MIQSNKQKKEEQSKIIEGISRKIKRELQDIIEQFECDVKRQTQFSKQQYKKLCQQIQELGIVTNDCYNTFIGDDNSLIINSRHPLILLNYSKLFLLEINKLKKQQNTQRQIKKKELQSLYPTYNQNNVYQLLAKNKLQFIQYQQRIKQLEQRLLLSNNKVKIAEEMTQTTKISLQGMLQVYRANYDRIIDLLKMAQAKENQFIQNNLLLKQEIEKINIEYNIYKKNYRNKINREDQQKRMKQKLQKQYQIKLQENIKILQKQYQYRIKNIG